METLRPIEAFYIILVASPLLFLLGAVAFFVLIVVGVQGDRRGLIGPPSSRIEAIARHVVGLGVRSKGEDES